jgi:hypothetical protein
LEAEVISATFFMAEFRSVGGGARFDRGKFGTIGTLRQLTLNDFVGRTFAAIAASNLRELRSRRLICMNAEANGDANNARDETEEARLVDLAQPAPGRQSYGYRG